jgi:hypothetical protein
MPDYQSFVNELICKKVSGKHIGTERPKIERLYPLFHGLAERLIKYPHVLRMLLKLKGKEAEGWHDNGRERAAPTSSGIIFKSQRTWA